ncbi:MAG: hypothetical protein JXM68_10790 [Sedimentisphaerales bacterium]|nr:hypothetical protein [Sedimentisphaerales bacterium]
MKLNRLNKGYIIVKSTVKDEYEYVRPSDVYTLGIYHDGAFFSSGIVEVYVHGAVIIGQKVRSRVAGDGGTPGMAVPVSSSFSSSYLRIGTAIEAGRNKLIKIALDIGYVDVLTLTGEVDPLSVHLDQSTPQTMTGTFNFPIVGTSQIKTNRTTPTDLTIVTGAEKTMVLDTVVWDDLRITPGSFDRPGVSDPAYVIYYPNGGGVGTYLPEFAVNDFASFTIQMPHSYKEGTNIWVHLHWTPGDRGNEESGATVGWKIDYSWADINGNFPDMQTANLTDACDGTDHKHQMTPEVEITGTGKHISSMLMCNIRRTDTGTDDTWAGTTSGALPLLLEVDFHFSMETAGSRTRSSK